MNLEFEVVADYINSAKSARVFRAPDAQFPGGRSYALRLACVEDGQVREGDTLVVTVTADHPDRIEHAVVVRHMGEDVRQLAHA